MNRFRTKKRAKEEAPPPRSSPRPSQDSEHSTPFRPFRKGKKQQENERVELDLSTALPSNDDFRTSLLMSGLSARFSMLREQDDPGTKIGKASDDSVLSPKRRSRLDFATLRALGDIAEVESIKAASPFARENSYHSDADSTTGASVMSRAKPTEGNNLFGGRQKIYKIPVGSNSSKKTGMGGRALYDDDVSLSAFQKWRQTERDRTSSDEDRDEARAEAADRLSGNVDTESQQPESPFLGGWDRKRETSSTTSSVPSLARNSTAATSVTSSQPTASVNDCQPNPAAPTTNPTTSLERNVTRTRRLYETGLNHDLQEQQSSAVSRFESLTRQRTFGTRTPELSPTSNSPTAAAFKERLNSDRKILAKASAPNLRSMSPPATASSARTSDLSVRVPSRTEGKPPYTGIPPVSPPVSESEDSPMFPIQPNDRGKATAMGVFRKPAQPYNESRYAQRQIQLQLGRETPTQKHRPDSKDSCVDNGSRPSSAQRQTLESMRKTSLTSNQLPPKDDIATSSFFLGDDSESSPAVSPQPILSPQLVVERPSDTEHPALRGSAEPTPPITTPRSDAQPNADEERSPSPAANPKDVSPVDSPTLGPTSGSGLSGMVRQHLRAESNASSIYSAIPPAVDLDARFPVDLDDVQSRQKLMRKSNTWDIPGQDWDAGLETSEPIVDDGQSTLGATENYNRDEFANQLADGARRVRERLTSYVETDSRSSSPNRASEPDDSLDLQPPRTGGLGLLRAKSSRGSLIDRGRDEPQSKAMKMLGIGGRSYSPTASRKGSVDVPETSPITSRKSESEGTTNADAEAGLRAFRQARRDLQRHGEHENQTRHQSPLEGPPGSFPGVAPSRTTPPQESRERRESPSRERKPPPNFFPQRMQFEEPNYNGPRSGSRDAARQDRDRSGSESGNDGHHNSRYKKYPSSRGEQQLGLANAAPRPLRSPGLPGTNIKNSPIMPPQARRNGAPAQLRTNLASNDNLHARYPHGQPSPISPIPSPLSVSGRSTPVGIPSRRPSVPQSPAPDGMGHHASSHGDGMRRKLSTKDISGPTLITSSHVPTITLPSVEDEDRSRISSRSAPSGNPPPPRGAPPLPPINPRRRHENSQYRGEHSPIQSRGQENNSSINGGQPAPRIVATPTRPNGLPGGMI
ncbi:hypothetical protein SLS62_009238 [Diatrype stigma]|uniref:Uncharacterized protein n=1 Tax=Diatrype stigma TaxID=117547 RepID=A0AAN9UG49_9PEZI